MEGWQEKRSMQTMNLRSVFTAEQQRILERYYENGMTNQSKSCFQLILQCAQETKLDFSVVRTWVGNKRRKLASKVDQNGQSVAHSFANHSVAGSAGGLLTGSVLSAELAAARSAQRGPSIAHLLPPASCPSSSSSPSSVSPLSSSSGGNNNNNNDVIVTGMFSLGRGSGRPNGPSHNRTTSKDLPSHSESEVPLHPRTSIHANNSPLHSKVATLPLKAPHLQTCSAPMYSQIRKPYLPRDPAGIPRGWVKQYGMTQHQSWPSSSQPPPMSGPATPAAAPPSIPSCSVDTSVRIQQVFTLAEIADAHQRPAAGTSKDRSDRKPRPSDPSETFSIAMETGDADDEYSREEELANMGAQMQIGRDQNSSSNSAQGSSIGVMSLGTSRTFWTEGKRKSLSLRNQNSISLNTSSSDLFGEKGCQTQNSFLIGSGLRGNFPFRLLQQSSPPRLPNSKVPGNSSALWLVSNSRKRTLQDRTQFSDKDLYTLKRYWDNGMTSLGSVCREKISAASTELSVDSEIIKTWIGNRRRKYRLMGIDIPPPKGGPAIFSKQASTEVPSPLTPEGLDPTSPEATDGLEPNDQVSICLSDDEVSDHPVGEEANEETDNPSPAKNVIEIIEDDDECDGDDDVVMTSDMEQMHNLLEFKHEEVQYLENELENQKQRYFELERFTRSLLSAMKSNDKEKQQELLASLPQHISENWDTSPEREAEPEQVRGQAEPSVSEEVRGDASQPS
ncbi:highly divergent homeobox isoform X2 [Denticeps clupeoides]|uniref:highly divergent homeobox isoform X2 n=1 Tax=Denticeps clupeoides TaxID=299321 RepID=UPI0010A59148|nr:highly divergent homeobox isoform X2 [Denticeps clupeoides]